MPDTEPDFEIIPQLDDVVAVQDLGRGWIAAYHMGLDRRRITSLVLTPRAKTGLAGADEQATTGELTARMLRRLAPAAAIASATAALYEQASKFSSPTMPRGAHLRSILGEEWVGAIERLEPGGTGHSVVPREVRLAAIAALYVEAGRAGNRHPTATVAAFLRMPQAHVRDRLYAARRMGLLEETGRGKSGGDLTAEARRLLEGELGWRGEAQANFGPYETGAVSMTQTPMAAATAAQARSSTPSRRRK